MISLTGVTSCAVEKAAAGSLTILQIGEKWVPCLTVLRAGSATLLALGYPDPGADRQILLLQGIGEQRCLVLGKAEFRFETNSLSYKSSSGYLMLGSAGPAIVGKIEVVSMHILQAGAWLISTGESVQIDHLVPYAEKWEVGVRNSAGDFEKVLSFPII